MSSSFKSQGNFFLEEDDSKPWSRARVRSAAKHLHKVAKKTRDLRLSALAVSLRYTTKGHFDKVVDGIDKMMADLHKENDMDLKVKEDCENDRTKNTKMAKNAAYDIDEQTAIIVRQKAAIEAKEAEEYAAAKADDEAAAGLIEKAKGVLEKFYS